MIDDLRILAEAAAVEASAQLELMAFGAVDGVLLTGIEEGAAEGQSYFVVSWSVVSMGMEDRRVRMVILPEFFEDEHSRDDLAEQMATFVVDRVLSDDQTE